MKTRSFSIGRSNTYEFRFDTDGSLTALPARGGSVQVIGGQSDLKHEVGAADDWSEIDDATGETGAQISDGEELYAGAGFQGLIDGQVADILWALGSAGTVGGSGRPSRSDPGPASFLRRWAIGCPDGDGGG